MDPNATVGLIFEAIEDGDEEELAERLDDLLSWIRSGGFLPRRLDDLVVALREKGTCDGAVDFLTECLAR